MKIYFCDICNESIPLKDINSNRITIEEGKIFCQKCAPKKAGSGDLRLSWGFGLMSLVVIGLAVGLVSGLKTQAEQDEDLRGLKASRDSLESRLASVPDQLKRLSADLAGLTSSVQRLGDDLKTAKEEITTRHDSLDQRESANHAKQQEATQKAIDQLTATLGGELTAIKDRLATMGSDEIKPLELELKGLMEKVDVLQDLVTMRGSAPNPGGGSAADASAGDAAADGAGSGPAAPDSVDTAEDKEINAQVALLANPDPGKRYSAVIALSRFTGDKVVKALESVLQDPEDYVRVAVIQNLRNLGASSSIPHIVQALRDSDYFVRVAARGALRALTGSKMDFDPDASPSERESKVKAWEKWWEENKGKLLKAS